MSLVSVLGLLVLWCSSSRTSSVPTSAVALCSLAHQRRKSDPSFGAAFTSFPSRGHFTDFPHAILSWEGPRPPIYDPGPRADGLPPSPLMKLTTHKPQVHQGDPVDAGE